MLQNFHRILSQHDRNPEFMIFKVLTACQKGFQYSTRVESATHHSTQTPLIFGQKHITQGKKRA